MTSAPSRMLFLLSFSFCNFHILPAAWSQSSLVIASVTALVIAIVSSFSCSASVTKMSVKPMTAALLVSLAASALGGLPPTLEDLSDTVTVADSKHHPGVRLSYKEVCLECRVKIVLFSIRGSLLQSCALLQSAKEVLLEKDLLKTWNDAP